jgi:hypothetical protein
MQGAAINQTIKVLHHNSILYNLSNFLYLIIERRGLFIRYNIRTLEILSKAKYIEPSVTQL